MKKTLSIYSIDLIVILISSILVSLLISFLRMGQQIDHKMYETSLLIAENIIFLIGGLFLGMKMKKRGLVNGLCFSIIYTIIIFLIQFLGFEESLTLPFVLQILLKDFVFIVGSLIAVNLLGRK